MDLEMVLNELSLGTPAPDIVTARQWMSEFIQTLRQATTKGVKRVLRTQDDLNYLELALNYPLARWRNDQEVDLEERRFLRLLTTKAPLWKDVTDEIKDYFDCSEVFYEHESALGLGFAWVSDFLAVSLCSESIWDCSLLTLKIRKLDESGDIIEEEIELVHASRVIHIQTHQAWIKNRISTSVNSGLELWERRGKLFPHLQFCEAVKPQISNLQGGSPILAQVKKRLFELEESAKNWTVDAFSFESLPSKATPESESRLQQFQDELTILCPDEQSRLFSLHLRMTPGAWRLYFLPLEPQTVLVGYIGHKIV